MSIKNKISLIVSLLFSVFLIAAAVVLVHLAEEKIRQSIITQQAALVKTLAYGFDQQVLARHNALISVAEHLPATVLKNPARLQAFIEEQIILPKLFTNILVYGPDGTILAAAPSPEKYVGSKRLAGMEYVAHTLETKKPYISKLFVSPVSGQPLIVMTAPILAPDGTLLAMLGGSQYILRDNLFSGFTDTKIGKTGRMLLITRERTVVAHPDKDRLMTEVPLGSNLAVDTALANARFAGETTTSYGLPGLMTIETMQTTGWLAGAFLPTEEAYEPITSMRRHAIQVVVALLLVLPSVVWIAMSMLSQPLLMLRDRIREMTANPEADCLLALDRHDEIGELAESFDNLTLARQSAEATQRRLNRSLRLLSDCNQTLIHAEEERHLLQDICTLILNSGGYPLAWVDFVSRNNSLNPISQAGANSQFTQEDACKWIADNTLRALSSRALQSGETQIYQGATENNDTSAWQHTAGMQGYRAGIALPLNDETGIFGVLNIYANEVDTFNTNEVALLEELAADLTFGITTLRSRIAHKAAEKELVFLAHHDPLTKLPNRLLLRDRFEQLSALAQREETRVAMLFLDLDNFKEINDTLGHSVGDDLLVATVKRLQGTLRQVDTISREGGDEFVVLLSDVNSISDISPIAQNILDAMASAFEINEHTLHTSVSIGISVYPNDGKDFETVRKNADTALYRAKESGRRNYRFFAEHMNIDAQTRMHIQTGLRKALQNQEFLLHYQPQIDLKSARIIGAEALIRWKHDDKLISPADFIPVAEHSGLIIPIGTWVLNEACRQTVAWHKAGLPGLTVAVNLSALQFKHGDIVETVKQALDDSGLAPQLLELELTESILLQDIDVAMATLHNLHDLGVKLAIDDFGTGYSSLSYLKRLSVDRLKIDQSFVRDLGVDADDAAIVKAIIQMGHTLQLKVIAEGVETAQQLAFLKASGCDEAQGYLFSRPVTAENFPQVFADAASWKN